MDSILNIIHNLTMESFNTNNHTNEELSKLFTQSLLRLIFQHNELYDKFHADYGDEEHAASVWEKIASQLNTTSDRCSNKWKSLCLKFLKFHHSTRKQKTGERYYYHNEMMPFFTFIYKDRDELEQEKHEKRLIKAQKVQNIPPCTQPYPVLLDLIYQHRELYDKYHPLHYDAKHKSNTWRKVAEAINSTEKATMKKWWLARRYFQKFYKNVTLISGKKHALHHLMERFLPYCPAFQKQFEDKNPEVYTMQNPQIILPGVNVINVSKLTNELLQHDEHVESLCETMSRKSHATKDTNCNSNIKLETLSKDTDVIKSQTSNVSELIEIKKENSIVTIDIDDDEDITMKTVENDIKTHNDLIDGFFHTICASVKNLTPLRQNQAKIRIFEIISSFELEQLQDDKI